MQPGRWPTTQVRRETTWEQKGQLFRLEGRDPRKDSTSRFKKINHAARQKANYPGKEAN
jgi:hypothetical protein